MEGWKAWTLAHGKRDGRFYHRLVSYLSNRKQIVQISYNDGKLMFNVMSDLDNVTCGVPQGSILGPLLFIIFINDLSEFLTCGKFVNFADDANVLIWANSFPKLERNLILCNIEMKVWCKLNKLLLNETKTSIIQFRSNFRTEVMSQ